MATHIYLAPFFGFGVGVELALVFVDVVTRGVEEVVFADVVEAFEALLVALEAWLEDVVTRGVEEVVFADVVDDFEALLVALEAWLEDVALLIVYMHVRNRQNGKMATGVRSWLKRWAMRKPKQKAMRRLTRRPKQKEMRRPKQKAIRRPMRRPMSRKR